MQDFHISIQKCKSIEFNSITSMRVINTFRYKKLYIIVSYPCQTHACTQTIDLPSNYFYGLIARQIASIPYRVYANLTIPLFVGNGVL